jgi:hypothetical protein
MINGHQRVADFQVSRVDDIIAKNRKEKIYIHVYIGLGLGLWCLTPPSTIFQLYH